MEAGHGRDRRGAVNEWLELTGRRRVVAWIGTLCVGPLECFGQRAAQSPGGAIAGQRPDGIHAFATQTFQGVANPFFQWQCMDWQGREPIGQCRAGRDRRAVARPGQHPRRSGCRGDAGSGPMPALLKARRDPLTQ